MEALHQKASNLEEQPLHQPVSSFPFNGNAGDGLFAFGPGLSGLIHLVGNRRSADKLRAVRISTEEVKPVMMTVQDVREKLGIGQATAYRLVYRGKIPTYKVGRILRIDPKDVDDYLVRSRRKVN